MAQVTVSTHHSLAHVVQLVHVWPWGLVTTASDVKTSRVKTTSFCKEPEFWKPARSYHAEACLHGMSLPWSKPWLRLLTALKQPRYHWPQGLVVSRIRQAGKPEP